MDAASADDHEAKTGELPAAPLFPVLASGESTDSGAGEQAKYDFEGAFGLGAQLAMEPGSAK